MRETRICIIVISCLKCSAEDADKVSRQRVYP